MKRIPWKVHTCYMVGAILAVALLGLTSLEWAGPVGPPVEPVGDGSARPTTRLGVISPDSVRRYIEQGYAQYIEAFSKADAAGVAGVYDENGARLYPPDRVVRGRAAIREDVARFVERVGPVRVTIDIEALWVMDDTVYETGQWVYTYKPTGEEERFSRGRYLTTWRRQPDGRWKMWADVALPG